MIYGTKNNINGTVTGKLEFLTGKTVHLNSAELLEFQQKIRDWQYQAIEQEIINQEYMEHLKWKRNRIKRSTA